MIVVVLFPGSNRRAVSDKRFVVVIEQQAQVYQAADINSTLVFSGSKRCYFRVAGEPLSNGWVKVRHRDGQIWLCKDYSGLGFMKIAILGAGAWGTALAINFLKNSSSRHEITLWTKDSGHCVELLQEHTNRQFLPGFSHYLNLYN